MATMKKGEKAILTCRSDYAYGKSGSPPTIPPDATLQFEVELLSWRSDKDISGDGGGCRVGHQSATDRASGQQQSSVVHAQHLQLPPFLDVGPLACVLRLTTNQPESTLYTQQCSRQAVAWSNFSHVHHSSSTPTGVIKTITKEGSGWSLPNPLDEVCVSYVARVQGQEQPFATTDPEGVEFEVQAGHLCSGLAVAVKTMKKGEQATLLVKPECEWSKPGPGLCCTARRVLLCGELRKMFGAGAAVLGPAEVVFTPGATETSNDTAMHCCPAWPRA